MTRISSRELRDDLSETLNRVAYGGETVRVHRRGKGLAVIIPEAAYAAYEEWEAREDARLLELARISDDESKGVPGIDAEALFRELGV
ncbi:MAG TPA: type II toxin-antitoxin system Phd/YefM family antitoxin [Armatimonadota bacterium]|jgi:prevent-host-death family protein